MGLIVLALAGVALWTLVRLGRQTEGRTRGQWRIAATVFGGVALAGAIVAASHGAWLTTAGLALAGAYLIFSSRVNRGVGRTAPPVSPSLSEGEARAILGVDANASPDQIQAAWRRLMGRAHPDQGGTEGLAARVNAARDRLLRG